jgi:thiol-disulfide isomerase/thioredoxin
MKRTLLLVLMAVMFVSAGIGCKKNASGIVIKNFEEKDIPSGKVVLVNFWATWCEPCKIEIPELIQLQQKYGSRGFTVLGVAMDDEGSSIVAPFVQNKHFDVGQGQQASMNYPIVIGNDKVADKFGGLLGYPTSVLLGKDGKEIHRTTGAIGYEEYAKLIEGHL